MTKLQEAVIEQLGDKQTLKDVDEYGAEGGYPGFTYYVDTCEFYDKNEALIWEALDQLAADYGSSAIGLLSTFKASDSVNDADTFKNMLAWFALEHVAHQLTDDTGCSYDHDHDAEPDKCLIHN